MDTAPGQALANGHSKSSNLLEAPDDLSPAEYLQIKKWNQTVPEEYHACVHHIFEQEVDKHPNAPAVCAWDGDLTYGELDLLSTRFSFHLVNLGVKRGSYVPFCFEKSLWTVVATAAILKAGGAYVPLDSSHPRERILGVLEDVGAKVVVASPSCAKLLSGLPTSIMTVSAECLSELKSCSEVSPVQVEPADPVLIFFTSGSTGRPKGIVLQHAAIATNARSNAEALGINCESRVLQFAAHGWDVATLDMWTTLMRGGCVCVPSEQDRRSDITGAMERMQVNWVLFTPSFVELVNPVDVPSLKTLVIAGEAMKQGVISEWSERVRLLNAYGPAETGICTVAEYTSATGRAESIGRQISANVCWIVRVDDHEKLAPIGSVGELLVEGPNLALCYLNDEAKTQAAFIQEPRWLKSDRPTRQRRLYKTGDLVKYQADGSIDFIGRKDYQVKVRGQRVELGEIESNLGMHPAVARALVSYPKEGPFKQNLVAVVQASGLAPQQQDPGSDSDIVFIREQECSDLQGELSAFLNHRLPSHMLLDFIIVVRVLPLSSSAKVDRKRVDHWLQSLTVEGSDIIRNYRRAATASGPLPQDDKTALRLSSALAQIIDPLNVGNCTTFLGRDVTLRDLGVNSIQYIKILMFIRRTWGVSVPLAKLTGQQTTVKELARYIENIGENGDDGDVLTLANALLADFRSYIEDLDSYVRSLNLKPKAGAHNISTVFLTGCTGFLGTQILRQLLLEPSIKHIIAHVRAENVIHGFERVILAAKKARWWQDSYTERLEVWLGDLTNPRLGLSEEQWDRLHGRGASPIDTVIHNGAMVNWIEDYNTLKPVNVGSTLELLRVSLGSTSISRFIYVSGGEQANAQERSDRQRAEDAVTFNGYAQTKLVSEMLVRDAGRRGLDRDAQTQFAVVKPGYIIGTVEEGVANPDDFLWRLAAGAIEVNGYNLADQDTFIFISSVDRVANVVLNACLNSEVGASRTTSILDGLTMEEFWAVFRRHFYDMHPMNEEEWLRSLRQTTIRSGETHPLYPCLHMIEKERMKLGNKTHPEKRMSVARKTQIQTAIKNNVKYLLDTGFLPRPNVLVATS
ncbi:hypothetical protein GJ744_006875 [Endocarpon pusillum]|uniref:Carrier domain-containing protein n=1 Tax=Endocarpon pusillum TaxID=364733 RepID=A0A8H7A7S2_9EURO|nr:hypothetical protein GJ744_006875 [Endocarpon pusillum]